MVEGLYQQEHQNGIPSSGFSGSEQPASPAECSKADWQAKKEEQARLRKKANDLKKTEEQIEALETRTQELDEELYQPEVATNAARCMELSKEKEEIQQQLNLLYEQWESLAE